MVRHRTPRWRVGSLVAGIAVAVLTTGCEVPVFDPSGKAGQDEPRETISVPAAPVPTTAEVPPAVSRQEVQRALRRGAANARTMGVKISAAVSSPEWERPAQVNGSDEYRMWSMAKTVTAVAALRAAREQGTVPSELRSSINGAIKGSENCRQRLAVLWLQELTGGPEAAADAVSAELDQAGASEVSVSSQPAPPAADCIGFLKASRVPDPLASTLQLGTSTWSVDSASRFALALAEGTLGEPGNEVFGVMQLPKRRSREQKSPGDYTAAIDWGAGRTLSGLNPAYKAGWGGVEQQDFVAGQLVALSLGVGDFGVALYADPDQQPPIDDPGQTKGPAAIEGVLRELRRTIAAG